MIYYIQYTYKYFAQRDARITATTPQRTCFKMFSQRSDHEDGVVQTGGVHPWKGCIKIDEFHRCDVYILHVRKINVVVCTKTSWHLLSLSLPRHHLKDSILFIQADKPNTSIAPGKNRRLHKGPCQSWHMRRREFEIRSTSRAFGHLTKGGEE